MSASDPQDDGLGRLDDQQEEQAVSDTTDGPAAAGEYDPAQGSPDSGGHPTGETYPDEATRFDEEGRRRSDPA